ncbi:hypothetical protein [Streptomyces sp. SudanB52_2052]|uniref:hypothetical protein n=1 Tax=Streptomyces sp. SudanB52_2052 TaxID=3035276 RepID=UPI003F562E8C
MEEEPQNLYEIAETVFNDERDGYTEEFEELTEVWGEDLLVLDKAELVEGWRGFGLGPMIAPDALRRLAPGCRAVMVHPAPIDTTGMSKDEWARARDRLRELWSTLGFVPYGDTPYAGGLATGLPPAAYWSLRLPLTAVSLFQAP